MKENECAALLFLLVSTSTSSLLLLPSTSVTPRPPPRLQHARPCQSIDTAGPKHPVLTRTDRFHCAAPPSAPSPPSMPELGAPIT